MAGEVQGFAHDKFAGVREVFEKNLSSGEDIGASFCATHNGETVVDLWGGYADAAQTRPWVEDTIVNVYSTTKTMTALTALLLADRGLIDYDTPIATYWPEFAANGKANVKVSHLMAHSAGLAGWKEPITTADLYDWDKVTSLLAAQAPWWEPGTAPGYHAITQGYLVGEVIRRVDRASLVGTVFREEIAEPLHADFWIGLPASEDDRVAELLPPPAGTAVADLSTQSEIMRNMATNPGVDVAATRTRAWRAAEIPAAGGTSGQCTLDRGDPCHPRQWRRRQGQALPVGSRLPQGAGVADRRPRPGDERACAVRSGLRPARPAGAAAESELAVLGRLWRLAGGDRYGCTLDLRLRDEPDDRHHHRRHPRLRPRHGDVGSAGLDQRVDKACATGGGTCAAADCSAEQAIPLATAVKSLCV